MGNLRVSSNSSDLLDGAGRGGPDLRRLWAMVTQVEPGQSSCGDSQVGAEHLPSSAARSVKHVCKKEIQSSMRRACCCAAPVGRTCDL